MPCPKDWSHWLLLVEVDLSPEYSSLRLASGVASGKSGHCMITRAGKEPSRRSNFYNRREGPLLWPSSAFTFSLLRHYAKQALTHGK